MKTTLNSTRDETKQQRKALRKRRRSILDGFAPELLQMEAEKKSIDEMLAWLKKREITTARGNLSKFLKNKREESELKDLREELKTKANKREVLEQWFAENPKPDLGTMIEIFKLLVIELATDKAMDPKLLALADKLARTAIGFTNGQNRVEYRERKLLMEEAKHGEWVKCEQARGLEFCLNEAKNLPAVADLFRNAFAALKATNPPSLRKEDGPHPMPASCVNATSPWSAPVNRV